MLPASRPDFRDRIMDTSKPLLLVLNPLSQAHRDAVATHHELIYAPDAPQRSAAIAQHASAIEAVLTIGSIGLTAAEIDAMPRLSLVCALGAGYENIAVAHAKARGIAVA